MTESIDFTWITLFTHRYPDNSVRDSLLELLKDENVSQDILNDSDRRRRLAQVMAGFEPPPVKPLAQLLTERNAHLREVAARTLGWMGIKATGAAPALVQTRKDENEKVRGAAAVALLMIGPEPTLAIPVLIDVLEDPCATVREFAAEILGSLGPEARANFRGPRLWSGRVKYSLVSPRPPGRRAQPGR